MLARYANANVDGYSPNNFPRDRRYILKNLNTKKLKQTSENPRSKQNVHTSVDDYDDIGETPTPQGSVSVNCNAKTKYVRTANKVMPTETLPKDSTLTPRKTPREPPIYVGPRRNAQPQNVTSTQYQHEKKAIKSDNNMPTDTKKELAQHKTNVNGLTARDEYMVTKLYENQIIFLKPSEVRYTHDRITAHFTDGRSIISTFIALLYGRVEIRLGGNDIPPIEVMQTEVTEFGNETKLWFVVNGNRRLYIFRKLEKCGALQNMQVIARRYDSIEIDKHFLTKNNGRTVTIINDASVNAKMSKELKRWKEWTAKQKAGEKPGAKLRESKGVAKNSTNANAANKSSCCTIS